MTPPDASNPWRSLGRRALRALAVFALLSASQVYRDRPEIGYGPRLASVAGRTGVRPLFLAVLCLIASRLQPDLASRRAGHDRARGPVRRSAPSLAGEPWGEGQA